jgi:hypothetical protein
MNPASIVIRAPKRHSRGGRVEMKRVAAALSATVVLVTCNAVGSRMAEVAPDDSKTVVQEFFAAINRGDAKAAAALFDAAATNYSEPVPRDARSFFQTGVEDILRTFQIGTCRSSIWRQRGTTSSRCAGTPALTTV